MKSEVERLGREKKDLAERFREAENQLEWVRSERDEEIAKLANEKKSLQDRLRESDSQLAQLKSRKRDELKVCMTSAKGRLNADRKYQLSYPPNDRIESF